MRPCYTEYARHCLRLYVTTMDIGTTPRFDNEVERNNWTACYHAVKNMSPENLEIIKEIYSPGDTIPDKIYNLAKQLRVPQGDISSMLARLEKNVARLRGLI